MRASAACFSLRQAALARQGGGGVHIDQDVKTGGNITISTTAIVGNSAGQVCRGLPQFPAWVASVRVPSVAQRSGKMRTRRGLRAAEAYVVICCQASGCGFALSRWPEITQARAEAADFMQTPSWSSSRSA